MLPWNSASFPDVDRSTLTPLQTTVLDELEAQYRNPESGEFYSEGVEQPWCANFVSWIMAESGAPYVNPNSGHWRIPGVLTLREYFVEEGRFIPAGTDYVPQTGDVAVYIGSTFVGQGEHTNMVVTADPATGEAITLGGNEMGKVRLHSLHWADDASLVGFGTLPTTSSAG